VAEVAGIASNCAPAPAALEQRRARLLIVIVCYRAADLTIDCLKSLRAEVAANPGTQVVVCENGTGPESTVMIVDAVDAEGWRDWVQVTEISPNRGFAGGNNAVLREALRWSTVPELVLLLNADTIVRPGAIGSLLEAAAAEPKAGIIGPRLEWPDGTPQRSCFHEPRPLDEFLSAARTGLLSRLAGRDSKAMPVSDEPHRGAWVSFACALIRREVLQQVGVLDDGFFLYFDDPDLCRRVRSAGWEVLYWPAAHVVHLRGRSNPVKSLTAARKRRPRYWYESRARYLGKYFGRPGLWRANLLWHAGRTVSWARERVGLKEPHVCEGEWRDIWINAMRPVKDIAGAGRP
jgi:N-acetylglucosaminyl-diphospho-decaprenol L-rhamnosyltransferase